MNVGVGEAYFAPTSPLLNLMGLILYQDTGQSRHSDRKGEAYPSPCAVRQGART